MADARSESSREAILSRIRNSLPVRKESCAAEYDSIPRTYDTAREESLDARLALFIDRLEDYDAYILRVSSSGVAVAVKDILERAGETRFLVPADFPEEFLPSGIDLLRDCDLSIPELETGQAVLTTCEVAVADTGTIVLQHHGSQGRRALTLLPDHHICIVREDQVVTTVPEAFARIRNNGALPITTISGPSATSDIEMTRIRGVHGPRRLSVIVVNTAG